MKTLNALAVAVSSVVTLSTFALPVAAQQTRATATVNEASDSTAPAPDAFCKALSNVPGVTHVRCSADGRPAVVSGHSPDGKLFRLEYDFSGAVPLGRINGGDVVPLAPETAQQLLRATEKAGGKVMSQCASGEVVEQGAACDAPTTKDGAPAVGFCSGTTCYGGSYFLNGQSYYGRITLAVTPNEGGYYSWAVREYMACMTRRDSQMSSCSSQYESAVYACVLTSALGPEALAACQLGMNGMYRYCRSLAPTC